MTDTVPNGNGRPRLYAPQISLGNILSMVTVVVTVGAAFVGFLMRYENRVTALERDVWYLDQKITLSKDVAEIRDGVDTLVDQHQLLKGRP